MTFEEQITRAFETLTERLRGEIGQQVQRTAAEIAAAVPAAAPNEPASASVAASASAPAAADDDVARERLADGCQAIDAARSLTEVLDTLVAFARQESPRAEVWLIRGGRLHPWRSNSAADAVGSDPPPAIDNGIPLTISGQTVAVLITHSQLSAQNSELRTQSSEPGTTNGEPRTTNVALLTRYASRALEALTAFKTARALTQHDSAECGLRPSTGSGRPEAVEGRNAEDDSEEDVSARRYARLLVSEIKLYHEPAVVEGRRDRDLVARLGGEITRARVMYEQRVPPHVRERADYFQEELVKTLANGDASLVEVRS